MFTTSEFIEHCTSHRARRVQCNSCLRWFICSPATDAFHCYTCMQITRLCVPRCSDCHAMHMATQHAGQIAISRGAFKVGVLHDDK